MNGTSPLFPVSHPSESPRRAHTEPRLRIRDLGNFKSNRGVGRRNHAQLQAETAHTAFVVDECEGPVVRRSQVPHPRREAERRIRRVIHMDNETDNEDAKVTGRGKQTIGRRSGEPEVGMQANYKMTLEKVIVKSNC